VDASGWHIMPGIIDAHSHLALDSINEGKVAISAECRIADMIRPQDVGIWRAAAGGTTSVLSLHGSANPIGGQAATWELNYWKPSINDLLIEDAAQNIKFALGENVKQSNWASAWGKRFPNTRVGVDAVYRRAFLAAQDYRVQRELAEQGRWPNFVEDVRLEVLADILDNKIHIQCHSYRADELLMFLKVCKDFGIERPTFQHVLEGYKVAPEMAAAGGMASTFSDWWAYKYEVKDAIPWNVEILHKAGVTVSINSDSDEMIRRLNTEAAKAMLYGGLSYDEAMATCTINSAKQLRLEHRLGSIEVGKDASISVFDQHPLSNYARCVLTMSEGKILFQSPLDVDSRWQQYAEQISEFRLAISDESKLSPENNVAQQDPELLKEFTHLAQGETYLIKNAYIHAISEQAFKGSILVKDGIISRVYKSASPAITNPNVEVIDARGNNLYPGFINALDRTGLVEIESLRASDDTVEIGDDQADLEVAVAIHADSAHHDITRMTGVSYVLTQPGRGRIRGQGAFIQLAGVSTSDMVIKTHGLFINFPRAPRFEQADGPKPADSIEELDLWVERCKEYATINSPARRDTKLEALIPYFMHQEPIFLVANSAATIMTARDWVAKHQLNVIYVSATDAYKVAGYLGADNARLIIGPVHSLPRGGAQAAFDYPYRAPSLLSAAGCDVALYTNNIEVTRNLPFQAATAQAWSIDDKFNSLYSITLGAAKILDLDQYIGSIEQGKVASFFLCDGDPLDSGVAIERLFIGGREVDLVSHQSQLRERYLKRLR
ncbi:MAG: amidohydrolase family protein, partial [Planctomycetota bacterium]|nr:amidohydrolase family protein [Planctomycetota bacterium]